MIQAIEHHLPTARVSNSDLAALYEGWTAEKILAKTGIRERAVAEASECASDLAVIAAEKLFLRTGIPRESVDLLVLCTQSPDYLLPTTACLLQERLGLSTTTAAFDVNLGCSGFPYGVSIARGLLETGVASRALFLLADTYTRYIHPDDRSVRTLFGDAASAVLIALAERDHPQIGPFVLGTDGSGADNLIVRRGGLRVPWASETRDEVDESGSRRTDANLYMNGPAILEFTMRRIPELVRDLLTRAGLQMDDVRYFVFHQANEYLLRYLQRKLKIPDDRFPMYFEHCGNTVSSTIPIVLQRLVDDGALVQGDRVMVVGFGVGYSWGAAMIRWSPEEVIA